jgi:hypothetical protein
LIEAPVAFAVAGDGYLVECDHPEVRDELGRWAAPLRAETGGEALRIRLRARGPGAPYLEVAGKRRAHGAPEDLVPALEGLVYDRLLRPERGLAVLHAAVAARGRRAVLFLGDSGAGKSVLSLRLARRGWTYLSDDLAPVDGSGRVLAVPRPVTCAAEEIEPALWDDVSSNCTRWQAGYRTPSGGWRTVHHACPANAAQSGAAFEMTAIYRLEPRRGNPPSIHRIPGPQARAWLFAMLALHGNEGGERRVAS